MAATGSAMSFVFALRMTCGALLDAAGGCAPRWDRSPAPGSWSPREIVEHAVDATALFTSWIADAAGLPFVRTAADDSQAPAAFATAHEAQAAGRALLMRCGEVWVKLQNEDLQRHCPGHAAMLQTYARQGLEPPEGWPPSTVAATLAVTLDHLDEHARELHRLASTG